MDHKKISVLLKAVITGMAICGAAVFAYIIPFWGKEIVDSSPELAKFYWPWVIFSWIACVPCYSVLVFGWRIATSIGKDRPFTVKNAVYLKRIALMAVIDAAFVFVGNLALLIANLNHPGVVLIFNLIEFFGIAFAVASAALSHLVRKAAVLQEESDLTI
ncbi:MAG: DUF2975 domain-containing protein [Clostridia bacterium]|nr:DUF2975 domain-containing protein [Clostridia bacterium]